MLEMANPERGTPGVIALGDHLINLWQQELRQKRVQNFVDEPLQAGEMPEESRNDNKLILVPEYFTSQSGIKLPKMLKRLNSESDVIYETRVHNYLLNMDDNQFTRVAELVDPEDSTQYAFFELYNEISSERATRPESSSKCAIF